MIGYVIGFSLKYGLKLYLAEEMIKNFRFHEDMFYTVICYHLIDIYYESLHIHLIANFNVANKSNGTIETTQ